jgi:hypothetical protein
MPAVCPRARALQAVWDTPPSCGHPPGDVWLLVCCAAPSQGECRVEGEGRKQRVHPPAATRGTRKAMAWRLAKSSLPHNVLQDNRWKVPGGVHRLVRLGKRVGRLLCRLHTGGQQRGHGGQDTAGGQHPHLELGVDRRAPTCPPMQRACSSSQPESTTRVPSCKCKYRYEYSYILYN